MKRKIYTLKILIMGGIIFVSTLACGINIPLLTTSEGNTGTDLPPALVDTPPSAKNDPSLPPPVILSGSGDSIVDFDIEALGGVAVAHITGNADSNHFSVSGIDDNGGFVNLLVDTSDPYDGFRPVNFMDYENATRFEVDASGDWSISLFPLSDRYVHSVMIPGSFFGRGDDILLLQGKEPDSAHVIGNADGHLFNIFAFTESPELLVNTSEPYDGTVTIPDDTIVLEITAKGEWTIEVTSK